MTILPAAADYTNKDFDALRARLFDLIRSVFPSWTDDAVANFGNILVEGFCFIGDVLTYFQDNQAREGRFAFVQVRKNMIALAKLIDYQLSGAAASSCDVVLTLDNAAALTGTVLVPAGTPIKTGEVTDPVIGELENDVTIVVATGYASGVWRNWQTQPTYQRASTNLPDQEFTLPFAPFLEGSQVVSTPTQGVFTKVDNFLQSTATDKDYMLLVDQYDKGAIRFGDGRNGEIPVGTISVDYKTGGGLVGNVEPNSLVKVVGSFTDTSPTPVKAYISVNNALAADDGVGREEVDAARENAPASLRVLNRTVAREDYEINAKRVTGVGRALMLSSDEDPGIEENHGRLYIMTSGGGIPSQSLMDQVYTMVTTTYPRTITFQLEVFSVVFLPINVGATIWIREGYDASDVKEAIEDALSDYFSPLLADGAQNPDIGFGFEYKDADGLPAGEIPWSDVFNVVRDVEGVRKVGSGDTEFTLNGLHDDVSIPNHKFPSLGTVSLINGDTSTAI